MREDTRSSLEIRNALRTLHEIGAVAEDGIFLLQTALIYNTSTLLGDCKAKVGYIKETSPQLAKTIAELAKGSPDVDPYVDVPKHLLRIGENLEKLIELMDRKVKEEVLFSDKDVSEITFLFQRLMEMLKPASDMILARNKFLGKYVQESEAGVMRRAIEYATRHEEKLIEGSYLPIASSLCISMLDAIKSIAWHAKAIAAKLT
jgi:Na+/phosphate symporter